MVPVRVPQLYGRWSVGSPEPSEPELLVVGVEEGEPAGVTPIVTRVVDYNVKDDSDRERPAVLREVVCRVDKIN